MAPSEAIIFRVATRWMTSMPDPSCFQHLVEFVAAELALDPERVEDVLFEHQHPMAQQIARGIGFDGPLNMALGI